MDNLQQFKEKEINNYLSSIDLSEKFLDIDQIKNDLRSKLGEEPAIRINYEQEENLNEDTGEKVRTEKMESITIIFTVEKEIAPGQTAPFPISKTFYIS